MKFEYKAVRVKQTDTGEWLVFFAAPAVEIDFWAGVPRKTKIGNEETTGFQRELDPDRLESLKEFYNDPKNIIQNPLLLATRKISTGKVEFVLDPSDQTGNTSQTGNVIIDIEELESRTLLELLRLVRADLEARVPQLKSEAIPPRVLSVLKQKAEIPSSNQEQSVSEMDEEELENASEDGEEATAESDQELLAPALLEESHIYDFWEEIAARDEILSELKDYKENEFLGFKKDDLIAFLKPVVVVDGQHRLWGATETAKHIARSDKYKDQIEKETMEGKDPAEVNRSILRQVCRRLPVSLLLSGDPAEHVFQFVVVNQKATQIGRALLGTIVSTSLSNEELGRVADRLSKAGIKLEQSRMVSYLSRSTTSPFYELVERGLESDAKDLLPWTVLMSLAGIVRKLKGGKLFNSKNDYAQVWRRTYLGSSGIVADYAARGFTDAYSYWESADGPWREVFIAFWSAVRDNLGSVDPEDYNNWGKARTSNLFNKISLTILESDFFQYLCEVKTGIQSAEVVKQLVAEWLTDVKPKYFNRDWKLSGVKKDSTGIRKAWARLWVEYRKNPQPLPKLAEYRTPDLD